MKIRLAILFTTLLLVFTIGFPVLLKAQTLFEDPEVFNTLDGLPSDKITAIAKDPEGFIWIGTNQGLSRYDGTVVETFFHDDENENSIKHNEILDVLVDSKNKKVWVAHAYGLSAYDPVRKSFKNYAHNQQEINTVPPYRAYKIFQDKAGNIWLGFQAGGLLLYRPETDDFERFLCFDGNTKNIIPVCNYGVVDVKEDANNENLLWLATHMGIIRFNKQTKKGEHFVYDYGAENDPGNFRINNIGSLLPHPNGKIYLGTYYFGITIFDPKTKTFTRSNPCYQNGSNPFDKNVIQKIYSKSLNEFWINSNKGLQLYDIRSNCIKQSFKNTKKESYRVDLIDEEGRIWNASSSHGLLIYNPLFQQTKTLSFEKPNSLYDARVKKILEDTINKRLYLVADESHGLYIMNQANEEWQCIPPPKDYDMKENGGFRAKDMAFFKNGAILIVESSKLYWYQPGFERLQEYPISFSVKVPRLRNILPDEEDQYWVSGFTNGVIRLDTRKENFVSFNDKFNEENDQPSVDNMTKDKYGNIWMHEHNGILIYERSKDRLIYHQHAPDQLTTFRRMGGLEADQNGNIWMATRNEYLGHGHSDSLQNGILHLYGKEAGLKGKSVNLVKPYKDKVLVFTETGLQVFNPATEKFEQNYDASFGVGSLMDAACILSDGSIAVGKDKSITIFHPDSLDTNEEIPLPYVSGFRIFDKTWKLKGLPSQADTVNLSYKQNFFSFDISSIAYNQPEKTRIRYQLEGFDNDWQDGTKRKFAAYTNVPGGSYRFLIEAVNDHGVSLGVPSITYLYISTVWWKAIWFWLLATVFILSIAYMIYKWRIAQVRNEEQVKTDYERELSDVKMSALRAQMNPHFIFNSLNSIEYYIINNEQENAVDYLGRFSRLIRLILQNSKSAKIPIKDELEALKIYMEMERMRFDNLFEYEVKIEAGVDMENTEVPPMIIQPYVENAIWHGLMQKKIEKGEQGKIELKLRKYNEEIICIIEDNGIGREAAENLKSKSTSKRKSFGMKITSDRLNMLNKLTNSNASVQIFDLKNDDNSAAGTRVELTIPLMMSEQIME